MSRKVVLVAGLGLIVAAAVYLWASGQSDIRYTADHGGTVPMWHRWVPVLVGIVLIRLLPPKQETPVPHGPAWEAWVLLGSAVAFAVLAVLTEEPWLTAVKLAVLLLPPLVIFWRGGTRLPEVSAGWHPVVPVVAWFVLSYFGPFAVPRSHWRDSVVVMVLTVVIVFLANALLEEVVYRRWLQTRWEHLLGRWPAIVLASLAWAVWHVGIQSRGDLVTDLASVAVNQGVLGLFLGYLWSRYRVMWPLLVVHGAVNAAPILLGLP